MSRRPSRLPSTWTAALKSHHHPTARRKACAVRALRRLRRETGIVNAAVFGSRWGPCDRQKVAAVVRLIPRATGIPGEPRRPIGGAALHRPMAQVTAPKPAQLRDRAITLIGYGAGLRGRETISLHQSSVGSDERGLLLNPNWRTTPAAIPASDPAGFGQIGCLYTAQGFEYDYAGVILGPDLVWRDDRWVAVRSANKDPDFRNTTKVSWRLRAARSERLQGATHSRTPRRHAPLRGPGNSKVSASADGITNRPLSQATTHSRSRRGRKTGARSEVRSGPTIGSG